MGGAGGWASGAKKKENAKMHTATEEWEARVAARNAIDVAKAKAKAKEAGNPKGGKSNGE